MATTPKKSAAKTTAASNEASFVKELADILDQAGLAELEYETEAVAIRLSRVTTAAPVAAAAPAIAEPVAELPASPADHPGAVKSPMVGTFYRSAAPGSPAFVEVGTAVKLGDTVCIIEAMKLLNEIDSEVAGVVTQILVENGQPVEFGQPLFLIG